ncbi:MAG TPA: multicopper oxidase domain-containing protein [Candidatus Angelobacter sp.]|jgi:FtsP/CotA-like multicopper oxidase with cupredoxin domain|nr:multicopper oxidase domain-containing protein [Candidatus Angelobacter sp.]
MPKSKSPKNKDEKSTNDGSLSRRSALKMGAAAGAATILTSRKSLAATFVPFQDVTTTAVPPPEPTICDPNTFAGSPATHPFVRQLPIPPALQPTTLNPAPQKQANIAAHEAPRADHQRWDEFLPKKQYAMHARPALVSFHPDLPHSYVWAFNGLVQGPTILGKYGEPVVVRFFNDLNANHVGPGVPQITIHLHNGHTASESDGFAGDFFGPQLFKDNHYPNVYAGFDQFRSTNGDPREAQHSYWYHDHRAMATAANTDKGLAGMYWLFDHIDSGDECDTNPQALRLPSGYGVHDIPLEFSDKLFCPDGTLFIEPNGIVDEGDKFCVNGAIQPFHRVNRRKYRFRLLNTGPSRTWVHQLTNGLPFTVVATDGNLLEHPIEVANITHSVAERYDVIVDFSNTKIGDHIYLLNTSDDNGNPQFVGFPSPTPLPAGVTIEEVTMRFDVVGDEEDFSQVPQTLTDYPDINQIPIANTKTWEFVNNPNAPAGLNFQINGKTFDPNRSDHQVRQGTAEIWTLRNLTVNSNWTHPVHIHFEEFRILQRNGAPPTNPLETGRKDVIRMPPQNEVKLFLQFRDFKGKYLIHCHNMNHEDNFMMVRWDIV